MKRIPMPVIVTGALAFAMVFFGLFVFRTKPLRVIGPATMEVVTSTLQSIPLRATGGHPPYKWKIRGTSHDPLRHHFTIAGSRLQVYLQEPLDPQFDHFNWTVAVVVTDREGKKTEGDIAIKAVYRLPADKFRRGEGPLFSENGDQTLTELPTLIVGKFGRVEIPFRGGVGPLKWDLRVVGYGEETTTPSIPLPPGLNFDQGVIGGTPQAAGIYDLFPKVVDQQNYWDTARVVLRVTNP